MAYFMSGRTADRAYWRAAGSCAVSLSASIGLMAVRGTEPPWWLLASPVLFSGCALAFLWMLGRCDKYPPPPRLSRQDIAAIKAVLLANVAGRDEGHNLSIKGCDLVQAFRDINEMEA